MCKFNDFITPQKYSSLRRFRRNFSFALVGCFGFLFGCGNDVSVEPPTIEDICSERETTGKILSGSTCTPLKRNVGRIELFDEEDNRTQCSAVIISPRKILSAAHCFDEFVFRARLITGSESREVVKVTYHPDAQSRGDRFEHDLAIGELDAPLSFSPELRPLASSPRRGETLYIFGYGRISTREDGSPLNEDLFGGTMTVSAVSDLFVEAAYDGSGSNTCRGDSGGPAFVFDATSGQLALSGLVSSGTISSCAPGDISVFTNLAEQSNRDFILGEAPELRGNG